MQSGALPLNYDRSTMMEMVKSKNLIIALFLIFCAASVFTWEGNATVGSFEDLPDGRHGIATNAFPKNTVVVITNLENNRNLTAIVVSGLDTSGLLATVSRSAAEVLGIRSNFIYRVLLQQPSDEIAYAHLRQLGLIPETAMHSPEDVLSTDNISGDAAFVFAYPFTDDGHFWLEDADFEDIDYEDMETVAGISAEPEYAEVVPPPVPTPVTATTGTEITSSDRLSLIPSEERIPEGEEHTIAAEDIIPPIFFEPVTEIHDEIYEYEFISGIPSGDEPDFSLFQAPLVRELEQDKWYVQIGAYSKADNVQDAIKQLETTYPAENLWTTEQISPDPRRRIPVTVHNIGSDTSPIFRVLLGPLNQGESAAMLQRVKSIGYPEAFIRRN
jgi:hypothetical protein